jgi:uncharacterized membrane protein
MTESFFKKDESEIGQAAIPDLDESTNKGTLQEWSVDQDEGTIASILSYIPFLCLIPLLQMRNNEKARFHSRQGLILFLFEILAGILLIPGLSGFIWKAVLILALGASAAGIIFGIQGKDYKLPIIGDIADKIKI